MVRRHGRHWSLALQNREPLPEFCGRLNPRLLPDDKRPVLQERLAGATISAPENKDLRESRVVIVFTDDGGLALLKKRVTAGERM